MNKPPRVLVWLEIPEDCRMAAALNYDDEIRFSLGSPREDVLNIVFERLALERFVQLASDALKLTLPQEAQVDPTELVSAC